MSSLAHAEPKSSNKVGPVAKPAAKAKPRPAAARQQRPQPKLVVGQVDDPQEREADRVAANVLQMRTERDPANTSDLAPMRSLRGGCARCARLSPETGAAEHPSERGTYQHQLAASPSWEGALQSGGQPLSPGVRAFYERRLGTDLGGVRVHTGADAADSARGMRAKAFTLGNDIAFGFGQYQPETQSGRQLLAHELVHVLQQHEGDRAIRRKEDPGAKVGGKANDDEKAHSGGAQPTTASAPAMDKGAAPAPVATVPTQAPAATDTAGAKSGADSAAAKSGEPLMPEPAMELSPAESARMGAVQGSAGDATKAQSDVPPANAEVDTAKASAQQPKSEADGQAQAKVVEALDQREPPSIEIILLCLRIRQVIRNKRPPSEDALVTAKPDEMAKEAGQEQNTKVKGDVDKAGGTYDSVKTTPEGTPEPGAAMPETPAKVASPDINAPRAVPDAVPQDKMSLDADVSASQKKMDDAGMNSEPAKLVEDGPIAAARAAQGELADKAKEDPAKVAAEQTAALAQANADMKALQARAAAALAASREVHVNQADKGKKDAKKSEEDLRKDLSERANGVFTKAQKDVKEQLDPLTDTAMKKWDAGIKKLSTEFKNRLKRVEDWITERHKGVVGTVVAVGDYIAGLPSWVVDEYDAAERDFGDGVCELITDISRDVNTVTKACEGIIAKARKEITKIYTQDLPDSLKKWASEQEQQFGAKLDKLQTDVTNTRADFNKKLMDQASGAVQEAREKIHELRQAARGLLGAIEDAVNEFLADPAKFIINGLLKLLGIPPDAFWAVVAKIQQVVKDIADDPVSFGNNLMAGLSQGFSQFFDNIGTHLVKGMLEWLLSGLKDAGEAGVAVPKDVSARSVVTFFLEILGISWPRIRKLLVEQLGEKTVAILEKAGGVIAAVVTKGISGIWEEIQHMLEPKVIVDAIIDAAIKYITETVIVKVAARIIMMFNPAGAILQAIEAIYRVLKWIFTNAARIFHLVEAVVNGIADVIAGNVKGMANTVEKALAMLIAPVIDFIADYIGLGGLPAKVASAIKGLRTWVEGILRKVIAWLVAQGKKLLAALGFKEKDKDKDKDKKGDGVGEVGEKVPFSGGGESHTLYFVQSGDNATLMVASSPVTVEARLADFEKRIEGKDGTRFFSSKEDEGKARGLIGKARGLATKADSDADKLVHEFRAKAKEGTTGAQGSQAGEKDKVVNEEKSLADVLSDLYGLFNVAVDEPLAGPHRVEGVNRESHHVPPKGLASAIGIFLEDLAKGIAGGPYSGNKNALAISAEFDKRGKEARKLAEPEGVGLSAIAMKKEAHTEEGGVHTISGSGPILQELAKANKWVVVRAQSDKKIKDLTTNEEMKSYVSVNPRIAAWRDYLEDVRAALKDPKWQNQPGVRPDRTKSAVEAILEGVEKEMKKEDSDLVQTLREKVVSPTSRLVQKAVIDGWVAGVRTVQAAMKRANDGSEQGRIKALQSLNTCFNTTWGPIKAPIQVSLTEE